MVRAHLCNLSNRHHINVLHNIIVKTQKTVVIWLTANFRRRQLDSGLGTVEGEIFVAEVRCQGKLATTLYGHRFP